MSIVGRVLRPGEEFTKADQETFARWIKQCDEIFDRYNDKEFAYQQMRLLAIELFEHGSES